MGGKVNKSEDRYIIIGVLALVASAALFAFLAISSILSAIRMG